MSARPLASLSSSLLARPGQAKPAMRPQPFLQTSLDDLGWNDMGHAAPEQVVAPIAAPIAVPAAAPVPPVLTERATLSEKVAAPKKRTTTGTAAGKAAFTLRLDADRHLRLRLASAGAGRSSQQLVVAALDAFLNSQPDVESLARQVAIKTAHPFSGEK